MKPIRYMLLFVLFGFSPGVVVAQSAEVVMIRGKPVVVVHGASTAQRTRATTTVVRETTIEQIFQSVGVSKKGSTRAETVTSVYRQSQSVSLNSIPMNSFVDRRGSQSRYWGTRGHQQDYTDYGEYLECKRQLNRAAGVDWRGVKAGRYDYCREVIRQYQYERRRSYDLGRPPYGGRHGEYEEYREVQRFRWRINISIGNDEGGYYRHFFTPPFFR
jgi:hypothetical protein